MAETTTITKPAPIIEGALTSFLETIKKLQPGTIPAGGFTGIDTTKFAPSIADQSQLQQFARTQAGGLGALMPQQAGETAQQFADRQAAFETARAAGTAGLVGADAYQAFMSPYQQEVIDETLAEGGMLDFGGREMDLRGGGFVPIGKKEKADDVPARLSKNEFVMTADAVRGAGGGNINKGAKRMYETMNRLEARA